MRKSQLILFDWKLKPGFGVSVGIAELADGGNPFEAKPQEIHRVNLGDIGGYTLFEKIEKTRRTAEAWIQEWYETQSLQGKLNEEVAGEIAGIRNATHKAPRPEEYQRC